MGMKIRKYSSFKKDSINKITDFLRKFFIESNPNFLIKKSVCRDFPTVKNRISHPAVASFLFRPRAFRKRKQKRDANEIQN